MTMFCDVSIKLFHRMLKFNGICDSFAATTHIKREQNLSTSQCQTELSIC